jgi:hypothetical protein
MSPRPARLLSTTAEEAKHRDAETTPPASGRTDAYDVDSIAVADNGRLAQDRAAAAQTIPNPGHEITPLAPKGADSNEYLFIYDTSHGSPAQKQVDPGAEYVQRNRFRSNWEAAA